MLTSVTSVSARSTANVPSTATPPMASGSSAATALPKTRTSRTAVTGTATDSARVRSCSIRSLISRYTWAVPPTRTVNGPNRPV